MRFFLLLIPIIFLSCSNWKISSTPNTGFYVKRSERVLVKNLNSDGSYNSALTEKINSSFDECSADFVDYESQLHALHYSLLDLDQHTVLDSSMLKRIGKATNTDFYLTGGFKSNSSKTGIGWTILDEYDKGRLSTLERWTSYQFLLFNLKEGKLVYQMDMKRKHPTLQQEDNLYYLPSIGVYNKLVRKLRKSCRCE